MNKFLNNKAESLSIENESVDLIITHPPYLGVDQERYGGDIKNQINYKNNSKKMLKKLFKITKEMSRILKNTGNIFICVGPNNGIHFKYIAKILDKNILTLKDIVFVNFNDNKNEEHLNQSIMIWFHLVKTEKYAYYNPFEIKKDSSAFYNFKSNNMLTEVDKELQKFFPNANISDSLDVNFCDKIIKCFSKPNDIVLDPMGGTGVVQMSALKNNRNFIYNDISLLQVKIAKKRIEIFKEKRGENNE